MTENIDDFEYTRVLKQSSALLETVSSMAASSSTAVVDKRAKPTTVKLKTPDTSTVKEIQFASWGPNNDDPNLIIAEIEAIPTSSRSLVKRVETVYGLGPFFYREELEESQIVIKPYVYENDSAFAKFIKKIRINRLSAELLMDAEGLANVFPEFIVSNDFTTITSIRHQEAKHCRFSVMKNGVSEFCGISSEWGTSELVTDKNCTVVYVADPYLSVEEMKDWLKKKKIKKFIFPVSVPSLGQKYYERPAHDSARIAKWTDIAKRIPSTILTTLINAKNLQWHIKIPYEYWEKEFPQSEYKSPQLRKDAMEKKIIEIDKFLSGDENAGKAFISHYGIDPISRKEYPGWIFDKLDGSPKFDKEILTTTTANQEIAIAWGVDPTVIGMNQLGQNNGAGSGSDKREADLIMKGNKLVSNMISEPIEFAIEFNGWGDDIKLGFRKEILTTLDKNPSGVSKTEV